MLRNAFATSVVGLHTRRGCNATAAVAAATATAGCWHAPTTPMSRRTVASPLMSCRSQRYVPAAAAAANPMMAPSWSALSIVAPRVQEQRRLCSSSSGQKQASKAPDATPKKAVHGERDGSDDGGGPPKSTMADAFRFIIPHIWPAGRPDHRLRIATLLAFAFGGKLCFVAVPFYFKGIIDSLVAHQKGGGASAVEGTAAAAEGGGGDLDAIASATGAEESFAVHLAKDMAEMTFGTGAFALVAAYGLSRLSASLMTEARMALFTRVGADAFKNINESLMLKMMDLDHGFHTSRKTGAVTKVIDRGSRAFASMAWCLLFVFVPTGFEMVLVCGLLEQQVGVEFVGVAVAAVATYIVWTTKVTNWRAKYRDAYNEAESKSGSMVVDCLLNYETVKYYRNEVHEAKRLRAVNTVLTENLIMLDKSMCALNFGQQFIFIAAATTSLYFAATGVLVGTMTVGDLVLVDALLLQLYTPLSWLGIVYREMVTSTQDMRAMLDLFNRPPKLIDAPNAVPLSLSDGAIEFRNASFRYGEKTILNDVSLTIPGGAFVAFVGPSGAGKTTLFRLLFRFLTLDRGQLLIDGQSVDTVTMDSVRQHIGVIPQDTVMFNDTVRYNVRYGKLDATDGEVEVAANRAMVHEAIERFDEGYDTNVGERGLKLSGGEKQRVAIARCLLQNPEIILADEATSALDTATEAEVVKTLRGVDGNRDRSAQSS